VILAAGYPPIWAEDLRTVTGIAAMCAGGGMGGAIVFEVPAP
jgi:acetyl-CoA acetyltransferase